MISQKRVRYQINLCRKFFFLLRIYGAMLISVTIFFLSLLIEHTDKV